MSKALPQRFGKYLLVRELAQGETAEVFKARMTDADGEAQDVVVKRIVPRYGNDAALMRLFADAARRGQKAPRPTVARVFEVGVADGSHFVALEHVAGKDLSEVLRACAAAGERLSVGQCVLIAGEVARGLGLGATPTKVMLTYGGEVKLLGFGVAEAARRGGAPHDARAEIFALGVMLWEMLTGEPLPRDGDQIRFPVPVPSSFDQRVDEELDPIVATCLAKDPGQRFASADALGRELTRWYYAYVVDFAGQELAPLMRRLFAADIGRAPHEAAEDEAAAAAFRDEPAAAPVAHVTAPAAPVTAAASDGPSSVHDVVIAHPARSRAGHRPGSGTLPAQRRRWPWIALGLVLLGGAAAAVLVITGIAP